MQGRGIKHFVQGYPVYLPLIILLIVVAAVYWPLSHGYFATDEWWGFSYVVGNTDLVSLLTKSALFTPLTSLAIHVLYQLFGINATAWASLAIVLHLIEVSLIYTLSYRLVKQWPAALVIASVFGLAPMGSEFVHQFSMVPTACGILFGMTSLVLLSNEITVKRLIASGVSFFIGLCFSPYILPFAPLAFLLALARFSRQQWRQFLLVLLPFALAVGGYLGIMHYRDRNRVTTYRDAPKTFQEVNQREHYLAVGWKLYQSYGELLTYKKGSLKIDQMRRLSTLVITGSLVVAGYALFRRRKRAAAVLLLGLLWVPTALLIFATLNTVVSDAYMPSRYLYVSVVGLGLLLSGVLMALLGETVPEGQRSIGYHAILLVVAMVIIGYYGRLTYRVVKGEAELGGYRKEIMTSIKQAVPTIGHDAMFCFTGNRGYLGLPAKELAIPFAHNFSFNLALMYRVNEPKLQPFFLEEGYFLNPVASFYYYIADPSTENRVGPGIGYATNISQCQRLHDQYSFLTPDKIYGFAYDSKRHQLIDISSLWRQYLAGDLSVKDRLYQWQEQDK